MLSWWLSRKTYTPSAANAWMLASSAAAQVASTQSVALNRLHHDYNIHIMVIYIYIYIYIYIFEYRIIYIYIYMYTHILNIIYVYTYIYIYIHIIMYIYTHLLPCSAWRRRTWRPGARTAARPSASRCGGPEAGRTRRTFFVSCLYV